MGEIIIRALALMSIVALGAILRRFGVFQERDFHTLSWVLINVVLPALVVANFARFRFGASMLSLMAVGFACTALLTGIGYLIGRRTGTEAAVLHLLNYTGFNIGCFALPFIQSFIGPAAVVATCLFDTGNALLVSGGAYALACLITNRSEPHLLRFFLKKLFSSPPLLAYFVMIPLNFLGVGLPALVESAAEIISAGSPFLSMLLLGVGLKLEDFPKYRGFVLRAAAVRLPISVALGLLFYFCLPFSLEIRQALTLCAFAPVALSCIAYTDLAGGDVNAACAWNSTSILLSLPLMLVVLLLVH